MKSTFRSVFVPVVLGVMGTLWATVCLAGPILVTDFSSGVPAGTSVSGSAVVEDGVLKLTEAIGGQEGFFFTNALDPGHAVDSFTASFTAFVGGGTCCSGSTPGQQTADGFSFNFANDLPASFSPAEEGGGTGLTVSFDSWQNDGLDTAAPELDVRLGGVLISRVPTTISQGFGAPVNFWDVLIRLDSDGTLDVSYNNALIVSNLLTGYTPILGGQFALVPVPARRTTTTGSMI